MNMSPASARGVRQILYTLVLVAFLKSCTPWLTEPEMDGAELPAITLQVTPKVQIVGVGGLGTIRVKITIPKNAQNRAVCVAVDGPMYRSSCFEHVGLEAASRVEWTIRGLDPGEYDATATLERVEEGSGSRKTSISRDSFTIS